MTSMASRLVIALIALGAHVITPAFGAFQSQHVHNSDRVMLQKRDPAENFCKYHYGIRRDRTVEPPVDEHQYNVLLYLSDFSADPKVICTKLLLNIVRARCASDDVEVSWVLDEEPYMSQGHCFATFQISSKHPLDSPLVSDIDPVMGPMCVLNALNWCNLGFTELPKECVSFWRTLR